MRVLVMDGLRVGEQALVGAGAVVTRDVEPYAVAAGVPARFLRSRKMTPKQPDHGTSSLRTFWRRGGQLAWRGAWFPVVAADL